MEEVNEVDQINEIIRWFLSTGRDYNNVNELMYNRARLVGFYVNYCAGLGTLRRNWNNAQAIRENTRSKWEMKNIETPTKAGIIAKANCMKELTLEKEAEGMYYEHKENIEAIKEVLNTMNQKIAHARDEWKLQKFVNQSEK